MARCHRVSQQAMIMSHHTQYQLAEMEMEKMERGDVINYSCCFPVLTCQNVHRDNVYPVKFIDPFERYTFMFVHSALNIR